MKQKRYLVSYQFGNLGFGNIIDTFDKDIKMEKLVELITLELKKEKVEAKKDSVVILAITQVEPLK